MSYGWLTESALLPKPSKKINVEGSSLIDLTVMLEKERKKRETEQNVKLPAKKVFVATNKGVEARNKKDLEAVAAANLGVDAQAKLEEKARIYDSLSKGKDNSKGKYLVDFDGKKVDGMTQEEIEKFEEDKEQFYDEFRRVAQEREKNIMGRKGLGEMTQQYDDTNDERLAWEAEALKDIGEGTTEEMKEEKKNRVLVKQSYDKMVTSQEKEKLVEVLQEQEQDKKLSNDIKKKREETQRLRQEKLKKLQEQTHKESENKETDQDKKPQPI